MISAADFSSRGSFEQLLIQYLVSLTITGLNALLPAVYSFIVRWEDYSPAFEVNITLIRLAGHFGVNLTITFTNYGHCEVNLTLTLTRSVRSLFGVNRTLIRSAGHRKAT